VCGSRCQVVVGDSTFLGTEGSVGLMAENSDAVPAWTALTQPGAPFTPLLAKLAHRKLANALPPPLSAASAALIDQTAEALYDQRRVESATIEALGLLTSSSKNFRSEGNALAATPATVEGRAAAMEDSVASIRKAIVRQFMRVFRCTSPKYKVAGFEFETQENLVGLVCGMALERQTVDDNVNTPFDWLTAYHGETLDSFTSTADERTKWIEVLAFVAQAALPTKRSAVPSSTSRVEETVRLLSNGNRSCDLVKFGVAINARYGSLATPVAPALRTTAAKQNVVMLGKKNTVDLTSDVEYVFTLTDRCACPDLSLLALSAESIAARPVICAVDEPLFRGLVTEYGSYVLEKTLNATIKRAGPLTFVQFPTLEAAAEAARTHRQLREPQVRFVRALPDYSIATVPTMGLSPLQSRVIEVAVRSVVNGGPSAAKKDVVRHLSSVVDSVEEAAALVALAHAAGLLLESGAPGADSVLHLSPRFAPAYQFTLTWHVPTTMARDAWAVLQPGYPYVALVPTPVYQALMTSPDASVLAYVRQRLADGFAVLHFETYAAAKATAERHALLRHSSVRFAVVRLSWNSLK
jgi:hypothetical protein